MGKEHEQVRESGFTTHQGPRGTLELGRLTRGVLLGRVTGHFTADLLPPLLLAGEKVLQRDGQLHLLQDWEKMSGYDSPVRLNLTRWMLEHRDAIEGIQILVQTKIVRMGVTTVALLLGGNLLQIQTNRSTFEAIVLGVVQRNAG
jgi:hypothetical protein